MLEYDDIYNDAWSRGDLVEWVIHLDEENDELRMKLIKVQEAFGDFELQHQLCIHGFNEEENYLRAKITALEDELNYYKIPQQVFALKPESMPCFNGN